MTENLTDRPNEQQAETRAPSSRFPDGFRILKGRQEYITYVDHSTVRIWHSEVPGHYDSHTHSAVEVIQVHRGESVYQLEEAVYRVRTGEILFIPSGHTHALTEEGSDLDRHLLLFEPTPLLSLRDMTQLAPMMETPLFLRGGTALQHRISELLDRAVACHDRREPMWNTQCYSYLLQVYAQLGRDYSESLPARQDERRIDSPIMNSAVTFINEHYMDPITLEEVADFAGFSKYYFSRTFKSFMGVSFSDFLTAKRVNAAAELLVSSDRSVQDIAVSAGFSGTATFNRVFRDHKKCTPTQYRAIYGTILVHRGENRPVF